MDPTTEADVENADFLGTEITFFDADLPHEEELLRNPFSVKSWLRYIDHKKDADCNVINLIYERALKQLPGSYKLWARYLSVRRKQAASLSPLEPKIVETNQVYDRALVFMNKMPRIWLDYCEFMMKQGRITATRHVFDRALRALPVTQHYRVWKLYLKFAKEVPVAETGSRIFNRYIKLQPEDMEDYINYLIHVGYLDEAATKLAAIINDDFFLSKYGKSKHQMWNELTDLISKNPDKVKSLKVEAIIRQGIKRFSNQIGLLWNSLADYYIRSGHFERARDIYEEAIQTVLTVRDFTQIFDAYSQFEESVISAKMEDTSEEEIDELDIDLRMARLEHLMDRRPLLVNSVLLRQNPHNVLEWLKRVTLFDGKPLEVINTFTEAIETVDPKLAAGKVHTLWLEFAKFYEKYDQLEDARLIFERAVKVQYPKVDDLAQVWCSWAEMEVRTKNYGKAIELMRRATAEPPNRAAYFDESEPVQNRVYKSIKLWSLYADLEESFGTFKSCKAVYDKIIDLRIASPQIVMNFAVFLEESNYFEESFRAYEKGIGLFKWPMVHDIWLTYLRKFTERYAGDKIERARDLFEQCLMTCPPESSYEFYLLYAALEENYGLSKRAMAIYDRAVTSVEKKRQFELFQVYLAKATVLFGVTHTREIYERAIEELSENQARSMCLKYAELEKKLGEIDRARGIFIHASQMSDPRHTESFWATWKEFEIAHGNEDTLREMLRIKRSVSALFNTQADFMAQSLLSAKQASIAALEAAGDQVTDKQLQELKSLSTANTSEQIESMATRERAIEKLMESQQAGGGIMFVRGVEQPKMAQDGNETDQKESDTPIDGPVHDPDEINLDSEGEEDEEDDNDEESSSVSNKKASGDVIEQQPIPMAVFGSLKKTMGDDDSD